MSEHSPDRLAFRGAAYRETLFQPPAVEVEVGTGVVYLRHPDPLEVRHTNLIALLRGAAQRFGDQAFLHERPRPEATWTSINFADFAGGVAADAGRLRGVGIRPGDRVVILARNSIANARASFGALALGAVAVPLSPLYLAHPEGAALLEHLARQVGSRLALVDRDLLVGSAAGLDLGDRAIALRDLTTLPGEPIDLMQAEGEIAASDTAKILFTSGSTGAPKAVANSHGMLTAAAAMVDQIGAKSPPGVVEAAVDWLPWHHTYGGNVNVHGAMMCGARFYIDAGAPTPAGLPLTLANLADVGPTTLTTVPAAFGPMLEAFRSDAALVRAIMRNLTRLSFGGAALAASVIDAYQALAVETTGCRIQFGSGYGMTETSGILALAHWPNDRGDLLGLPVPGVEMKLVELDDGRFECRVRGPNVFGGYLGQDSQPFDEDGFFITGDAVLPAVPGDWAQGLVFGGRIVEDFKLANGVWVRAGRLRAEALERLGSLALDAVIVGASRDEVGILVLGASGTDRASLHQRLAGLWSGRSASASVMRASLLGAPPDARLGEITPKGSLNVVRLVQTRADEIDAMFKDDAARIPPPAVLTEVCDDT